MITGFFSRKRNSDEKSEKLEYLQHKVAVNSGLGQGPPVISNTSEKGPQSWGCFWREKIWGKFWFGAQDAVNTQAAPTILLSPH